MKKRANGEGTIRKRANGTWEARYSYGGKQHSVYGKTQADVRRKLTEAQAKIDGGAFTAPSKITVAEWLERWQRDYLRSVKASTRQRYEIDVRVHLIPALGGIRLSRLDGDRITALYNAEQDKGLSVKSIQNLHGTLHKALQQAVKKKIIAENPCDDAVLPTSDEAKEEMHPLRDGQVAAFLKAIQGNRFELLFRVAMFTGMRQGEIIGLTWDCVDFTCGKIYLRRQLKRIAKSKGKFGFTTLKNKQTRTIKPPAEVMNLLKQIRRQQAELKLRAGELWDNEEGFVFTDEIGHHVNDRTVYNNFKMSVESIGLPAVRFHDLRHTYATLALQNGIDYKTLSENMGHATVGFTMDKYGHVSETMMQAGAEKMQRFIDTLPEAIRVN